MPIQKRREFDQQAQVEIITRATGEDGNKYCEYCGVLCKGKDFEIDHVIAEGLEIDKRKRLTARDGKLACIPCHDKKTPKDQAVIAEAKRREARHLGAEKPNKQPIPQRPKPEKAKRDQLDMPPPKRLYVA